MSFGSGEGLHEALLARRFSTTEVCGVDLRPCQVEVSLRNLRFLQGDLLDSGFATSLPRADFVYSIECLEHIEDDRAIFAKMKQLVRPGGSIYLEVPFATEAEQADKAVCRRELEAHGHVRPGYSERSLEQLARDQGLVDIRIAGAFWFPIQPMIWLAQTTFAADRIESHWREFLEVAQLDLRRAVPLHRAEATAIKLLARRPRQE